MPCQALLPTGDHLIKREARRSTAIPRGIELCAVKQPAGIVRDHGLRILDLGAFAPDQILRDQRVGTLVSVHIDRRLAILRKRHLRQIGRNVNTFVPVAFVSIFDFDTIVSTIK